jgi:hypothetical protein
LAIYVQSATTHTNYCATSDTNLELSLLSNLPTNQTASVNQDLLNATYWHTVLSSAGNTFAGILPNTAVGLLSTYQDFRNWGYANIPGPPSWLATGAVPYLSSQLVRLRDNVTSAGDSTQARMQLKGFFASVSGASLTAVDFVLFGGITGIKTYFETGSVSQAVCATFPGQLAELYVLSGSASVSSDQRAQYLGQALAITSVVALLAGHDQFAAKFKVALDKVGLLDSWPAIKPHLSQLVTKVSQRAGMLAFSALEVIAQRFPQNAVWYTGLTADRIGSMAEVLQNNGVSTPDIESKIQGLLHAAGDAQNGDDVARDADIAGYQSTGKLEVKVVHHNELYRYFQGESAAALIDTDLLSSIVKGFQAGQPTILRVTYWDGPKVVGAIVYHYYQGGENWVPTVPTDVADTRGNVLTISVQILSREQFVADLPRIDFYNYIQTDWGANIVSLTSVRLTGDDVQIQAVQVPTYGGISGFTIDGKAAGSLSYNARDGTSFDVRLTDVYGQTRTVRIYCDGHTQPSLGIWDSDHFATAHFVSFDTYRLRFASVSSPGNIDIATVYAKLPTPLYSLGDMAEKSLPFSVPYAFKVFQIDHVEMTRQLEVEMRNLGTNYDRGRLGAEIAYAVATEKLGLKGVIMHEPSVGGNDLETPDGTAIIQARMLASTSDPTADMNAKLRTDLSQMTKKLHDGFKLYPQATGYAILTYVDLDGTNRVIVVEVHP